jgi:ferredoxin-NADP reductase
MATTYPLRVVARRQEGEDSASLWFEVPADLRTAFSYRTGQFVTIHADVDGQELARQYSLASVPDLDEGLQITVKRLPEGRVSGWLVDRVREGDVVEVAAPRGRLYQPADGPRHYLLLAAGSGIVPLVAIARDVLARDGGHAVTLAYGNRSRTSVILRREVDELAASRARVEHVLSRPDPDWTGPCGHVDPGYLARRWPEWTADGLPVRAYLCGPDAFMAAAEAFLVGRGVDEADIRRESFDLVLNDDEQEPDLLVPEEVPDCGTAACTRLEAALGGDVIEVVPQPEEPLLSALLRVSDEVPFSCQEGTCSSCIVRLVEGQVGVRPGVLQTLRRADLAEGLILACLSRARTATVRIDFDQI